MQKNETIQYSTVQYSTAQYSTAQHSTVKYSTGIYIILEYITVQYNIYQCNSMTPSGSKFGPAIVHCWEAISGKMCFVFAFVYNKQNIHLSSSCKRYLSKYQARNLPKHCCKFRQEKAEQIGQDRTIRRKGWHGLCGIQMLTPTEEGKRHNYLAPYSWKNPPQTTTCLT